MNERWRFFADEFEELSYQENRIAQLNNQLPELRVKKMYATTALTEPPLRLPKMAYLLMTSRLFFLRNSVLDELSVYGH